MIVVLDSGVLGDIANPKASSVKVKAVQQWGAQILAAGHTFCIPAIAVYETRRELVRMKATASVAALDAIDAIPPNLYLPITDAVLWRASELWAQARSMGKQTAGNDALDGDVILCAQVLEAGYAPGSYIVATTNVKHLSLFVTADVWQNISP